MADDIDSANDLAQAERDRGLREAQTRAQQIPVGVPGDCGLCGEWSGRLVGGTCASCRDKWGLP